MELYLDSVDPAEIEAAFKFGTLAGLTTTPTFLHRHGITDIDAYLLKLAELVPILQVEALGETADQIVAEADRQIKMGLQPHRTVFKIPISNEGVIACKRLHDRGIMVNVHLVYTVQQAYMAMLAGATYVCPLVGRLQDQGHDALALVKQCVDVVNDYGFKTKIMFSSVRHPEHVRNALNLKVHTITVPWSVMKGLTTNHLTTLGTNQFIEHTRLVTMRVGEVMSAENPVVKLSNTILDAVMEMTQSGTGATSIVDANDNLVGIFTDGDLRRMVREKGNVALDQPLSTLTFNVPKSIAVDSLLQEAVSMFRSTRVDNLIVVNGTKVAGMLDIQDLVRLNLI